MERARKMANRAILRRILSESNNKCHRHPRCNDSPLISGSSSSSSSSSSSYSPSRYVSSLSAFGSAVKRSDRLPTGRDAIALGGVRTISVDALKASDTFPRRHNSATPEDQANMARSCGFNTLDSLIDATVPKSIRIDSMKFSKFGRGPHREPDDRPHEAA
ncbi:hypothetical protein MLD38_014189 [Melastoma candidum]|uniref:Uncharacterized protein n=1 Tax=Melastoma candidum TaxID=119954 RepID=A0ACB9RBC4_9MYRT|nr:hypothetical protein MLD38_014189 [Melastoma candidum]